MRPLLEIEFNFGVWVLSSVAEDQIASPVSLACSKNMDSESMFVLREGIQIHCTSTQRAEYIFHSHVSVLPHILLASIKPEVARFRE
jgi:hypothetical protein